MRHSNAVVRDFYEFWLDMGSGPLVNPVALDRSTRRSNAHHNPLDQFRPEGRIAYNPKLPKQKARAMPDERWADVFTALGVQPRSCATRGDDQQRGPWPEVLGLRGVDIDWSEQPVRVHRKGTRAAQWLPASPEAFVWLRLYLADLGEQPGPNEPVWWTLRRRDHGDGLRRQPMNYEALRAVFRRINAGLGTNWKIDHDLRHTAALRMSRDPSLARNAGRSDHPRPCASEHDRRRVHG